jgi:hypothetical protein
MTLEPIPLSNGLEARNATRGARFYVSAVKLWGFDNGGTYLWLDARGCKIEIGTSQISPIRWEKRPG